MGRTFAGARQARNHRPLAISRKWQAPLAALLAVSFLGTAPELPLGGLAVSHDLAAIAILFALATGAVALVGMALHVLMAVELLHKGIIGVVLVTPLAFADPPSDSRSSGARATGDATEQIAGGLQLGLYAGGNGVPRADVVLKQPPHTDMVLKDVPWTGAPFEEPPFYGGRATYWAPSLPSLGVMLDLTHAKAISRRKAEVEQTGMRKGQPVPGRAPVSETFTKLEYSHGLNFATLNAVYRFTGWQSRVLPYFGVGVGFAFPHTEIARVGASRSQWTYGYEISGPAFQGLVGLDWRRSPARRWSAFTEYKATYAMNRTELVRGGTVETNLWAHQAIGGVSYMARPSRPGR